MPGPLSHVRVLELSRVLAGPWAAQTLADLGADVIKVERPGAGDDTRAWGPPWAGEESAYFLSTNRGKRSITIDFERPEGQELVRKLAAQADVVIENFKVGGLVKYGLDYDSLKAINPGLVYCSITGFGQDGPYAKRAGYDFMIQGMGGLMSITGQPDTEAGGGPVKVGVAVTDVFTGLYATIGVLGALAHRDRTGEGQWVNLALLDVQVAVLANQAMNYLVGGKAPQRLGNAHPNIVPYQAFATLDGHIILAVGNDGQFAKFCQVAGRPELAQDPRYATNPARVANRKELVPILELLLEQRTSRDWLAALEAVGVPCGPINDVSQVFADPHVQARHIHQDLPHPTAGTVPTVASPIRYSATPIEHTAAPPTLGQHTDAVLEEALGLCAADIAALREKGVV
ncbi:CoA transferase (plasmid) [Azospirillum baldaniorum]|uniref:L-carnitine dehydrogenase n=1 Tax=Azospirillum baldaniorum TaxID=1064539 RepID=A0A9P1NPF8_9PROT|nr:CaiB/BaiF CoA-transferase family protein [Azospirillum baldaniorum]AWJ92254.1 CoA transferase [Azospirillum baldaniorum]NUB05942.1 CoA transferase [Azospirillum baldaniorum]TWA73071.1 crotonobetainyl-CoA:carnitine CoA-transferase CaiB-like acyl-CoA transferase [Azospirillum brasilense]CCD00759.1 putative L-carnitine dehydrogenase [Azospirillum baldaniorum]